MIWLNCAWFSSPLFGSFVEGVLLDVVVFAATTTPQHLLYYFLGGGFKYLYSHPEPWGRFPFWLIFFKWVGSTTSSFLVAFVFTESTSPCFVREKNHPFKVDFGPVFGAFLKDLLVGIQSNVGTRKRPTSSPKKIPRPNQGGKNHFENRSNKKKNHWHATWVLYWNGFWIIFFFLEGSGTNCLDQSDQIATLATTCWGATIFLHSDGFWRDKMFMVADSFFHVFPGIVIKTFGERALYYKCVKMKMRRINLEDLGQSRQASFKMVCFCCPSERLLQIRNPKRWHDKYLNLFKVMFHFVPRVTHHQSTSLGEYVLLFVQASNKQVLEYGCWMSRTFTRRWICSSWLRPMLNEWLAFDYSPEN